MKSKLVLKMKNYSYFIIIILMNMLAIVSCDNDTNERNNVENIKIDFKSPSKISLEEIIESCYILPLETNNENIIGYADKICITDDYILILDAPKTNSVYIFDHFGKYLTKIDKSGRGPGEYISINNIKLHPSKKYFTVNDESQGKLMNFDFEGNFINEIKLPLRRFGNFEYLSDDIVAIDIQFTDDINDEKILLVDLNKNEIIKSFFKNIDYKNYLFDEVSITQVLNHHNNDVYYMPFFQSEIFLITEDSILQVAYKLDNIDIPDKFFPKEKNTRLVMTELTRSDYPYYVSTVYGDNFLYIGFEFQAKKHSTIYSKKTGTSITFNDEIVNNTCLPFKRPKSFYKGNFVSVLEPSEIMTHIKNNTNICNSTMLDSLKSIKIDDNPVLMFFSLKEW